MSWSVSSGIDALTLGVTSSLSGDKMYAYNVNPGDGTGFMYISGDGGTSWTQQSTESVTSSPIIKIACSSDGSRIIFLANDPASTADVYFSTDSGVTFTSTITGFTDVAVSANSFF